MLTISSKSNYFPNILLKIGTHVRSMAKLSCVEGFSDWTIFDEARGKIKIVVLMTLGH